jgi:catechol 2,3-dioxygenase-like lactoylglutathione lyase family enzyme
VHNERAIRANIVVNIVARVDNFAPARIVNVMQPLTQPLTSGINHLGLTVKDLDETTRFFVDCMGWTQLVRDDAYPRTTVSDGKCRLTLWQADRQGPVVAFDRRSNIGLHHVAFELTSYAELVAATKRVAQFAGVIVEFEPEPVGSGPRMHAMIREPGGLRIELIWPADS